ncbi:MAG TPA: hypothetical protein VK139_00825 [Microbacteriaceae bacterium]|nr:hypothetical protein [Microbacteriaceae bacterium]
MSVTSTTLDESGRSERRVRIRSLVIAAVFGLLYAYDVWEAAGNLVGIVTYANGLQVAVAAWGWAVLIGATVLPGALWVAASLLGWRRSAPQHVALQLAALALSATSYLSIITLFNDTNLFVLAS